MPDIRQMGMEDKDKIAFVHMIYEWYIIEWGCFKY